MIGTARTPCAMTSAASRNARPAAVCDKGRPAESSATMFQRSRWWMIRCARDRSGVTTATRFSGTSKASRTSSAMACASSSGSDASSMLTPVRRRFSGGRSIHVRLASGGRNSAEIAWLRSGGAAVMPLRCQARTSSRATPMRLSSNLRWYCGCVTASPRANGRIVRRRRGARAAQLVPHGLVHRQVEVRKDDRTLRQFAHRAQQAGERGRGAVDARGNDRRLRRIGAPCARSKVEQTVAPGGCVDDALALQPRQPARLHIGEQADRILPVACQIGEDADDIFVSQLFGPDIVDQQAVHRRARLARQPQEGGTLGRFIAHLVRDQLGQREQAALRIDGGRNVARAQRIEQRTERFVEVEIADHDHARHQHARRAVPPHRPHERLGHRAPRAAGRQQQRQPRQPQIVVEVSRDQPRHQRIGKAAMGGDGIDLRPCASALPVSHSRALPRSGRCAAACRLRTTCR